VNCVELVSLRDRNIYFRDVVRMCDATVLSKHLDLNSFVLRHLAAV
jgi:hypothetical protein